MTFSTNRHRLVCSERLAIGYASCEVIIRSPPFLSNAPNLSIYSEYDRPKMEFVPLHHHYLLMEVDGENDVAVQASTRPIQLATSYQLSSSKAPLFAIEHPAILSSIDAGVKSLGGPSALSKVLTALLRIYARLQRITKTQNSSCDITPMTVIDTPSSPNHCLFKTSSSK
jgi:hypothetical protein